MTPHFDLVGIVTDDMARSTAFYRRLGVDVADGVDEQPHVEGRLGPLRLAWDTPEVMAAFDPSWAPSSPPGHRVALGFRCANAAEVDSTYADLTGAGFEGHLPPWDAFWGQRYAVLHDPDGNTVDLFADMPQ